MSCGGGCGCCGGPDLRTPEERRADEAKRVAWVMRVFVWGAVLAGVAAAVAALS